MTELAQVAVAKFTKEAGVRILENGGKIEGKIMSLPRIS